MENERNDRTITNIVNRCTLYNTVWVPSPAVPL